jgi:nitrogen fixation NifU-like protein
MSRQYYTRAVIDHFRKPRNQRSMEDADGVGWAVNKACSDVVRVFIRVDGDTVADCTFQAQGCVACVAAASVTTELVCGQSLDRARTLSTDEVVQALGGLPESKVQCSVISPEALHAAVRSYESAGA